MQNSVNSNYSELEYLEEFGRSMPAYNKWVAEMVIRQLPVYAGVRAMDFGFGAGVISGLIRDLTGVLPIGVDLDSRLRESHVKKGFQAFKSAYEAGSNFNLIFSSNVLEHIEDDRQALKELRACTADGGGLVLFVPAMQVLWSSMDEAVCHYRRYQRNELMALVENSGYDVIYCQYKDSVGFFATLFFKLFSTNDKPSARSLRLYDRFALPITKFADVFFGRFFGKNLLVVACARSSGSPYKPSNLVTPLKR